MCGEEPFLRQMVRLGEIDYAEGSLTLGAGITCQMPDPEIGRGFED